jgi:hypothetical protein
MESAHFKEMKLWENEVASQMKITYYVSLQTTYYVGKILIPWSLLRVSGKEYLNWKCIKRVKYSYNIQEFWNINI